MTDERSFSVPEAHRHSAIQFNKTTRGLLDRVDRTGLR